MTLDELIEALEGLRLEMPGSTPVRLATQPSWPFEHSIAQVVTGPSTDGGEAVFLGEGDQNGYLPGAVSEELGW